MLLIYCILLSSSSVGFEVTVSMYLEDQQDAVLSSLYLFYCQVTLHVSGVSRTHNQEYTNCTYNHWYKS